MKKAFSSISRRAFKAETSRRLSFTSAFAAMLLAGNCAQAAVKTWQGSGSDFNTSANWNGGLPGAADTASFAGATPLTVNISAPISIYQLGFTATGIGYDLTSNSNNSVQLTLLSVATGSSGAINAVNTSGTNTIDAALFLGGAANSTQQFTQALNGTAAGGTLLINGVISGNSGNSLTLNTGVFTLTGANTYTGNTTVSGSNSVVNVTSIGNSGASGNLGAGTAVNLSGGTVRYTGVGETTTKGLNLVTGGTLDGSGAGGLIVAGAVTSTGTVATALNLKGSSSTVVNAISGNITDESSTLTTAVKLVTGQWTLSGTNSYSGASSTAANAFLNLGSATALGNAAWTFASGTTLDNASGGDLSLTTTNAMVFTSTALNFTGTHSLNLGAGAVTISGSALVITVSANTLTVGGAVGDAGAGKGFTKSGAGTLILNGNDTYTGPTALSAGTLTLNGTNSAAGPTTLSSTSTGTLVLGSSTAVGSGTFTFSGGTLQANTDLSGTNAIPNAVTMGTAGSTSTVNGSNNIEFKGLVTATNTRTLTNSLNSGATLSLSGGLALSSTATNYTTTINGSGNTVISGVVSPGTAATAGSLTMAGPGTLTLSGANTYGGLTTISSGTLLADGTGTGTTSSGTGTGAVSLTGGTLGGAGRVLGKVTVGSGAILQGGDGAATGMLTLAVSPTLSSGSIIGLTLGSGGTHSTLALAAGSFNGFNANQSFVLGNLQTGTYDNIITGVAANIVTTGWTITNGAGDTYSFTDDGTNIDLSVTAVPEPTAWMASSWGILVCLYCFRRRVRP